MENSIYENSYKIVYDYLFELYTSERNDAIKVLANRDFDKLYNEYIHFFYQKEDIIFIEDYLKVSTISEIINNLKILDNQSEYRLTISNEGLIFTSQIYTIVDESICEKLAKTFTKNILYGLDVQPKSKNSIFYRKLIESKS